MPSERFDVFFSGALIEGQDPDLARERIRRLFKASDAQMAVLFSGQPVALKRGLDLDSASRYRLAFRQAGALIEIRPSDVGTAPTEAATTGPSAWRLLPANTGSLEEFAPVIASQPRPDDTSHLQLAAAGTDLDATGGPTAPRQIDTASLSLVPGTDWSLEDCQPATLPLVMPDLEDLTLAPPGSGGNLEPERKVTPPPEVPGLSLAEPDSDDETAPIPKPE